MKPALRPALALVLGAAALSGCATGPREGARLPTGAAPQFALEPADFDDIPEWESTDLRAALVALQRACNGRRLRAADQPLPGGGRYGGRVGDWASACNAAPSVAPGSERAFFETFFRPYVVSGQGETRLTAYYEPVIEARRAPDDEYSAPLLRRPRDMVSVDVAAFAEALDNEALRGAPRALTGRLVDNAVVPYPRRGELAVDPDNAFAWAHPVDVYNLQIQGSGRIRFADGSEARAAFAAQNGYRWRSALGALRDSGALETATWASFKAWSDSNGHGATQAALNADPSYVFFSEEPIGDPNAGPRGAAGVPLTPMGSIAVDPAFHPYGALIFVDGSYDGAPFRRLLVAQDTGGAIRRGPLRGDVFFGAGDAAGDAAERMNAPARWWTLLPRGAPVA